ncbi:MAG: response regulator [Bacteroidales bacterium]|nr:response regulator [Bacteroidales bacterium]
MCRNNCDLKLILMDIRLPEMNGYEVVGRIREFNKDVIIIAQTAYALANERELAIKAGCDDYITKPFIKEDLIALINKHLKLS